MECSMRAGCGCVLSFKTEQYCNRNKQQQAVGSSQRCEAAAAATAAAIDLKSFFLVVCWGFWVHNDATLVEFSVRCTVHIELT
eukprot:13095-Heterococcus_DN1.PRE.1